MPLIKRGLGKSQEEMVKTKSINNEYIEANPRLEKIISLPERNILTELFQNEQKIMRKQSE